MFNRATRIAAASRRRARRAYLGSLPRVLDGAERFGGGHYTAVESPPAAENRPRYGWGRPAHPQLAELLRARNDVYRGELERLLELKDDMAAIGPAPGELEPG